MDQDIRKRISMQTRSVRELIYESLKEAILIGDYEPGFHLRERELAKEFEVSTTPVKEALRHLEKEGLIVTQPRRGSFVSDSVMSSVEEIRWARAALEGVAARLAAIKRTNEDLEKFRSVLAIVKGYTKEQNSYMLGEYNEDFHALIRQSARNTYILNQIEAVRSFDLFLSKKVLSDAKEMELAYQDHYFIFEKIEEQNPDAAEDAMRGHIKRSTTFALNKAQKNK